MALGVPADEEREKAYSSTAQADAEVETESCGLARCKRRAIQDDFGSQALRH